MIQDRERLIGKLKSNHKSKFKSRIKEQQARIRKHNLAVCRNAVEKLIARLPKTEAVV